MDENHFLHLTDVGREVAEKIYERHCFFTERLIALGVNPETAETDACRIEHVISAESFEHLKKSFKNNNQEVVPSTSNHLRSARTRLRSIR